LTTADRIVPRRSRTVTRTRIEGDQVLRPAHRWLAAASVALAATALTACGGSTSGGANFPSQSGNVLPSAPATDALSTNLTASALATAAYDDMRAATSVHVVTNSKNKKITTVLDIDFSGNNSTGNVVVDKTKVLLIRIGSDVYVNGPDAFWQAELAAAKATALLPKVHGKWVKNPTFTGTFAQVERLTSLKMFMESVVGSGDPTQFVKGGDKVINKVVTIPLTDHTTGSALYVAKNGKPYPVQATGTKGATSATSTFDSWNKPFVVKQPPAAQVYVFTTS
jgi:hypothetical protein